MARPLRITFPGAFYHVTSRGNERKPIFKSKGDREKFLAYLQSATERYNAVIHVFCLMTNHYHLLLETPAGNLPQIMRHINGAYTTYFNVKRARSGHLFQGRYKAIVVEKDGYAKELSRYIHLNPVRAKMVAKAEEYDWSSYKYFIGLKRPPEWLQRSFILGFFGDKTSAAQKGYKNFVAQLVNQTYESPLNDVLGSVLLGSRSFNDFIKDNFVPDLTANRDVPGLRQLSSKITILEVCAVTGKEFGDNKALARNVTIYLCHALTGEKLKTIGNYFGISDSAVSQASKRLHKKLAGDHLLKKQVNTIKKAIKMSIVET